MALQMRPFLTAYEMVGGARAEADKAFADASSSQAAAFDNWGKMGDNVRARQEQREKQAEIELASKETRMEIERAQAEQAGAAAPAQVAPAVIQPQAPAAMQPAGAVQPQQAPQEAAQSFPVNPGSAVSRPLDSPVPVAEPAIAPQAPAQATAPIAAEAIGKPVEQSQPSPAAQAAPVQPAPKVDPVAQLRSTPVINGKPNLLSDDVADKRVAIINRLAAEGKIRSTTADEMVAGIQAGRAKQFEAMVNLQTKMAEIADKDISRKAKAIEVRAAMRGVEDDLKYDVFKVLKSGDIARAQQLAREYSFGDVDFNDPATVSDFGRAAARAPQYYKEQKEIRDQKQEGRLERDSLGRENEIATGGLPDGYFRMNKTDRTIYKMEGGKPVPADTAEVNAVINTRAKSGATTINTGDMADPYVVGDKKFAEKQGETDSADLTTLRAKSVGAKDMIRGYQTILQQVTDPKTGQPRTDLPLGPGQGIDAFLQRLGVTDKNEQALFARNAVVNASAGLELDAAGRMKGQGALTDSERGILRRAAAGDTENFTAGEWQNFARAQIKVQQAQIRTNNAEVDNIGGRRKSFDVSTFRSDIPGEGLSQAPAAVSIPPAAADFLMKNPTLTAEFDRKYGAGAAAKILGK